MKTCSTCKLSKDDESFAWKQRDVKRSSICKSCQKLYRKKHYENNKQKYIDKARAWEISQGGTLFIRYRLTEKQAAELWLKFDGNCWLCRTRTATVVDHDHECCPDRYKTCGNCVRGVLCGPCNKGLGLLGDTPSGIQSALDYLQQNERP